MEVRVPEALDGMRVDRAVSLLADISRAAAARLVADGLVEVDGVVVTAGSRALDAGQQLRAELPDSTEAPELVPDGDVPFVVVHSDDDVIVVDKPAGVVVHPGHGHWSGTLVHGLLARFPDLAALGEVSDRARPGIVHRLDRGTSGLLVVARTPDAYRSLVAQLTDRTVERRYTALVYGHVEEEHGVVDAPIGRSGSDPTRMAVSADGRPARTRYRVTRRLELASPVTLLDVGLETGRTHQIRVHLAAIGHPVVDDQRYAKGRLLPGGPGRPFLHASSLAFDHPASGARAGWTSPLPEELARVIDAEPG